jgi:flagellar P-ring protein precursor FlgI
MFLQNLMAIALPITTASFRGFSMFCFNARNSMSKAFAALTSAILSLACVISMPAMASAQMVHLKDIAKIQGVTNNQLVGYGLIVGLAGTGDSTSVVSTEKTLQNVLQSFGVTTSLSDVQVRNVAAVIVTANLPPFAHSGDNIDVTVSSLGDATSLQGGTLIMTELRGPDSQVYGTAQGAVSIGGFSAGGASGGGGGSSVTKNHPAVGRVPNGAIIARAMHTDLQQDSRGFSYVLDNPDAQTASRVAKSLNARFGYGTARANDYATVRINLPARYSNDPVDFVADAGDLSVNADETAKVILNERTGTVVMGGDITLAPVAIAHGNLTITVSTDNQVVQPGPLTSANAATQTNTTVKATETGKHLIMLHGAPTLAQVVRALNTIGVSPRDLIAIVQALKEAGSLQADVEII